MHISIFQAILLGLLYYLTNNGTPWVTGLGSVSIRQPIVCGAITGLILGDVTQGVIIGATINTLYLGFINAGGTLPADAGIGGIVGTALALSSGASAEAAIAIAVPLGIAGTMIWTLRQTVNIYFVPGVLVALADAGVKRNGILAEMANPDFCLLSNYNSCSRNGIPWISSSTVRQSMHYQEHHHILSVIGSLLPAIGIGMLLKIWKHKQRNPSFSLYDSSFRHIPGLGMLNVIFCWYPCIRIL